MGNTAHAAQLNRSQVRLFEAGPDPFGRMWTIQFRWLQTAISIRHADTVDVKFLVSAPGDPPQEKVIALPHAELLRLTAERSEKLTDPLCMRLAALHLVNMISTFEDMEKTLVTVSPLDLAACNKRLHDETVPHRR